MCATPSGLLYLQRSEKLCRAKPFRSSDYPFLEKSEYTPLVSRQITNEEGNITELRPGGTIVLKESAGPRQYRFGKRVVYVTRSGRELDEATVRTKITVGAPVRVHYMTEGGNMVVDRVTLDED